MRVVLLTCFLFGAIAEDALAQTTATARDRNDARPIVRGRQDRQPPERTTTTTTTTTTAAATNGVSSDAPTPPPAPDAASLLRNHGNSLLKSSLAARADASQARLSDVSFYAVPEPEPKVIRKHDLVTIIVREESQFSSEGTAELTRDASINAAIEEFVKLKLGNVELEGGAIGPTPPSVAMNGSREFTGEGTVDRSDRFTARLTAEVLDVKPNGTLVLQARKRIKTDEEEQCFTLSGTCRAEDISADNTILSTHLHDQELTKTHKGTVRNATRRGWGGKLLDAISPF